MNDDDDDDDDDGDWRSRWFVSLAYVGDSSTNRKACTVALSEDTQRAAARQADVYEGARYDADPAEKL